MTPITPYYLEITVLLAGFVLLMLEAFSKDSKKTWIAEVSILILSFLFCFSFFTSPNPDPQTAGPFWHFYSADAPAMFFKRIALLTTIVVLAMSLEFRGMLTRFLPAERENAGVGEFYCLPIFTCAGLMFMASAVDFLSIFVSLELVTISFYILVGFMRRQPASLEAGVKYLILGALSTGFLVYGITWIYGITGETNLAAIAEKLPTLTGSETPLLFGIMLVLVGLGFKVAAAPFQIWVPDVYQGAPTPVTAFLSVGSKAAGFIVLMRVLQPFVAMPTLAPKIVAVLSVLAVLSLLYGNLAAMPQENLKRLLAYSSIGHAGYLLVAVASFGSEAGGLGFPGEAIAFYLMGYLLMTLLSFLVMIVVANNSRGDDIAHFNGLARRSPFLAFGMLIAMLSLAGLPFTVGFYGKFLVFAAAVQQHHYLLVAVGAITVAAGFYYYLRVIKAMYWEEPNDDTRITLAGPTKLLIGGLALAIIVFGIYPGPILKSLHEPVRDTVASVSRP